MGTSKSVASGKSLKVSKKLRSACHEQVMTKSNLKETRTLISALDSESQTLKASLMGTLAVLVHHDPDRRLNIHPMPLVLQGGDTAGTLLGLVPMPDTEVDFPLCRVDFVSPTGETDSLPLSALSGCTLLNLCWSCQLEQEWHRDRMANPLWD